MKYSADPLHQGQLRAALFIEWAGKCAWCGVPLPDPSFGEVDHVIARSRFAVERGEFAQQLPDHVGRDDVENLALICGAGRRCNQVKGNGSYVGAQADILARAAKKAPRVRRRVLEMRAATGLDADMQRLLSGPLDKSTRRVFKQSGALLAQRLDAVGPELIDERTRIRRIDLGDVETGPTGSGCFGVEDDGRDATAALDKAGREAYAVARLVCQFDLDEVIGAALRVLIERLDERIRDAGLHGDVTDGGFGLSSQRDISVHTISVELQSGGGLRFTGHGTIWSLHSASIAWIGADGETRDGQSDVCVDGTFRFSACTSIPDADVPTEVDEMEVDDTAVQVERI